MTIADILSTVRNFVSSSSKTNSEFKNESIKNNTNINSAIRDISKMFQTQIAENTKNKNTDKVLLNTIRENSNITNENNALLKQSISLQNDLFDELKRISSSISTLMEKNQLGSENDGKASPLDKALETSKTSALMAGLLTATAASAVLTPPQGEEQPQGSDVFGGGGSDSNSMVGASQYDQGKVTLTSEDQKAIIDTAQNLGIDPVDLSTVISYETAGTFNPNKMGGKGGNYMGLIQFGPEERKKYGVKPGMTIAEQMSAVESFLTDRGLKKWLEDNPDASLADKRTALYSTINAGSPGEKYWSRSDRPGFTVQSHTMSMFSGESGHYKQGAQFLETAGYSPGSQNNIETTSESGVIPESNPTGEIVGGSPENSVASSGDVIGSSTSDIIVKQTNHPDTGNGYTVEGAVDKSGRPVVFGSENAARAFGQMMIDSGGLVKGDDVASSQRSEEKNKSVGGVSGSKHLKGNALDIHGESGQWIRKNGSKYGWSPNDYPGSHGGHFEFGGQSQPTSEVTGKSPGKIDDKTSNGGASERLIPSDISGNLSGASDVLSGFFGMNFNGVPSESMTPMGSLNVGEQIETITNSINNILPSNPNDIISQIQTLISENITPNISRPTPSEGVERRLETSPYSDQTNTRASWWRLGLFPDRKLMEKFSNRFV